MPKIESEFGTQNFPTKPLKHVAVPDESGYSQPPTPPSRPVGGGQFTPSVARRQGNPMSMEELQEFQDRMNANMDPDSQLSDVEREFQQARAEKRRGMTNLNDGARRRIEMLIGMTRSTRTALIGDNSYVLQTLKAKEMREAIMAAAEFDGTVQSPFEIRRQILARSLVVVAGVPMDQFAGSNDLDAKLDVVDQIDDILLNRLMDEYGVLTREAKDKYAIKTTEEAKEVAEDLKK